MTDIQIAMAAKALVMTALTGLNSGNIDDVMGYFADEFRFNHYGIGLQCREKDRLAEFFQKARELYPDSFVNVETVIGDGDHVFTEWILQATLINVASWPKLQCVNAAVRPDVLRMARSSSSTTIVLRSTVSVVRSSMRARRVRAAS